MFVYRIFDTKKNVYVKSYRGISTWLKLSSPRCVLSNLKIKDVWRNRGEWDEERYVIQKFELCWRENVSISSMG